MSWKPPRWPGWVGGKTSGLLRGHPRGVAITFVALAVAGLGGWKWWQWRQERLAWEEAHRARPDKVEVAIKDVTIEVQPPGPPAKTSEGTFSDAWLRLYFDRTAAPLDHLPLKNVLPESRVAWSERAAPGIKMAPAHPGTWVWSSEQHVIFRPSAPWPADAEYDVTISDDFALQPEVRLAIRKYTFKTAALTVQEPKLEFYTDPTNPALHQVVASLNFSHPVTAADVEKHLAFTVVGGSPIYNGKDGKAPSPLFTLVPDKDDPSRHFWARSVPVTIPVKEDFALVTLRPGMTIAAGGKPMEKEVFGRVTVPDISTGLAIVESRGDIIRDDEGEPAQYLSINTRGVATLETLTVYMDLRRLPEKPGDDPAWASAEEVTPEAVAKGTPVKFNAMPSEETFTQDHNFRLDPQPSGQMLVTVKKGLPGPGGFILPEEYRALLPVPEFPRELSFNGRGGLMALNGERKLTVKSRRVSHIRYTLARVPAGQINHLVSMTRGNFESPYFRSGIFGKENIARIRNEVVKLDRANDYEAVWSAFDFTPATQAADAADPDASRGLFFLTAEAVRPREKKKEGEPGTVQVALQEDEHEAHHQGGNDPDWVIERVIPAPGADDEDGERQRPENGASRFVLVTDLGLLVKQNADASRDVFVQSVSKGGPVAGVALSVLAKNGETVAQAQTDAEGHAKFESVAHLQRDHAPVAMVARLGNDLAVIPWQRQDRRMDFSRFDTAGVMASEAQALDAFLFTERGVYRPGDKVHLGIAVRPRGWEGKIEGVPVSLEMRNAAGQPCFSKDLTLTADGFLECDGQLNENDATGIYSARLLLPDPERPVQLGRVHFRVEDFQPDRMKLAVTLPGVPGTGWRTNPEVKAHIDLKTLFGFPAEGRRVTGKVTVSPAHFRFSGFPDHTFFVRHPGHVDWGRDRDWELGEIETDADGSGNFDLGLTKLAAAAVAFTFYAEAFEADGGRSVAAAQSGLYSPLENIVGYKADGDLNYIGQDAARSLHLVCLGPDAKVRAAPPLTIQIAETRYHSILTRQKSGSFAYNSTEKVTVLSENPFTLPAEGATVALPVNKTGTFDLKLVDAEKKELCSVRFVVAGKGQSGRSLEQNAELEMKLAREEWQGGEELECSLSAPFTGAGLLTIEREKVLGWQWFRSGATDSVQKIRVPESLEGTAYVNASFVRALDSPEVFMSPLSYAVAPFRANMAKRRNDLQLDCPPVVMPGSMLKIGFRSTVPSRAVVYAVDEGIHQITNYELPQPLDFFLRKRSLEVETLQIMDLLLPEFTVLGRTRAFGGDGGDGEERVNMTLNPFKRRREAPVVYWSGIVETGPVREEVEYAVPDYFAGQLTIMAVAAGGSNLGASQTKTIVRGPFVLSPNAPLFAAPGDTFTASLTIANNTDGFVAGADRIKATLKGSENVEVIAPAETPVLIATGKEGTVRFNVKAREPLGNATLTFRVEAGGVSSERNVTLSVRPATPRLTTLQSGWFRTPEHRVKTTRLMHHEFAQRETSVSSLPLNLARGLEKWLHEFPHGCTEQIVSRAMARTVLSNEAAFGFDRTEAGRDLEAVFAMLRGRQMPNGSFGLWGRHSEGDIEILTPYTAHFLTEAKEAGFAVPPDLLSGALRHLRVMAAQKPGVPREQAIVARAIYLLTRNGSVTTNYLLNLRDIMEKGANEKEKDAWQAGDAAPWLACTYAMLKMDDDAKKLMTAWMEARRKAAPQPVWEYYYEQALAREATVLALLSRHFPNIAGNLNYEDLQPITRGIERMEFNTYSAAASVMALKAWSALQKNSDIYTSLHEVAGGAEPRLLCPVGTGLVSAEFAGAAEAVQFGIIRPEGAPDMGAYYQIVESGFDRAQPTEAVREGLEVMRDFSRKGAPVKSLEVGESVDVSISLRNLTAKRQPDIALVDLLPCGFEVEAGSLVPGPRGTPGADSVDVREDRNIFYCSIPSQGTVTFHYRVKPVCAGMFDVPPASASSMYDHAIQARGVASQITVASRE